MPADAVSGIYFARLVLNHRRLYEERELSDEKRQDKMVKRERLWHTDGSPLQQNPKFKNTELDYDRPWW